ncbi:hypothetical protein Vafri_12779 [Volvox africanus]|uniref:Methionine synthase reductase n=1 Tax=Volvox africanus TaxID=51714 RepID=A0A8J4BAX4_9CHLO|nr:hypothetical protein Vafri_12779 [Volvox africanus]
MATPSLPFPMDPNFKESILWLCCNKRLNALPPQPPIINSTRRSDIFAAATAKPNPTPATSLAQQVITPSLSSAVSSTPVPAPPSAGAAPSVQLTPTRSLVPEQATEPPKLAKAPLAVSDAPKPGLGPADASPAVEMPATGGAAILARFRKQRTDTAGPVTTPTDSTTAVVIAAGARSPMPVTAAAGSSSSVPKPAPVPAPEVPKPATPPALPKAPSTPDTKVPITILYGSQTGTCLEIARNLAAEAVEKGFNASCASLNERGFAALSVARTPVLVVISSSTGDGDPPDNASSFFTAMRRKPPPGAPPPPPSPLSGIRYTVLGLGDSNYTRFMYVPRAIKGRLAELGAKEFYRCAEADEVEGVENIVDPWTDGLWTALKAAVAQVTEAYVTATSAAEGAETVHAEVAVAAAAKAEAEALDQAAAGAEAKAAAEAEAEAEAKVAAEKAEAEAKAAEAEAEAAKAEAEAEAAKAEAEAEAAKAEAAAKAQAEAEAEAEAEAKAAAEAETEAKAAIEAAAKAATEATEAEAKAAAEANAAAKAATEVAAAVSEIAKGHEGATDPAVPKPETPPAESHPAADAFETAASEAAVTLAADAGTSESGSLLPEALVGVLEASVAPTSGAVGLPTIAESRVFEDGESGTDSVNGPGSLPLPAAVAAAALDDGRPDSSTSYASGSTVATRHHGTNRRSSDMGSSSPARRRYAEKPPSRLQAKPINVNFPKREETVVKRKDEKVYGMLMGLAPVGVDTKGAPALLPCRLKLHWEKDEGRAKPVRDLEATHPTREERHRVDPQGMYSAEKPFWAHISDARYETAFWSDRKVIHLELSIRGSNIVYEPGDSIGVLPVNHPDLVANLCKRLHLNPDRVFTIQAGGGDSTAATGNASEDGTKGGAGARVASHIPSPCSVGYALSHCVDLTSVTRKSVLRLLAEHAVDAAERRTLMYLSSRSQGGKEAYSHEIGEHQPSILDLLVRFRSVNPPLEALLDALPPLMPRMYSISSSRKDPARGATHLSVALSVVRFKTRYGTRLGVATTWLDRLAAPFTADGAALPEEPIHLPIFLRRSADFKPPPSLATPLIMVGPGTGVAPFRGFLQDRRVELLAQKPPPEALGDAVLFFGCRREDEDYLYKEELEAFKADGTLSALHVAFSRAQAEKVYVQDLIKQHGEKVWSLLQGGAHVYVCGDGVSMAKDVHAALAGIVQHQGGMNEQDATTFLQNLAQERRYIRDVWS